MGVQVLRDHTEMPWANGGGITHEVARFPITGDFDWRISLADVTSDGPFSVLPGIDRTLVLLEGKAIKLTSPNRSIQINELEPYKFAGETEIQCTLTSKFAKDLNIMTRRATTKSKTVLLNSGTHQIEADAGTHILVCLTGQVTIEKQTLNYREAAIVTGSTEVTSTGTFAHIAIVAC
jgi:environmental stress-induced protein Ves